MNLKPIVRFQCQRIWRVFFTMYVIVYLITAFMIVSLRLYSGAGRAHSQTSGLEFATVITIFIVGLNSFKEYFLFYTANGVSRHRMFFGVTAALGITAAATALIDTVSAGIYSLFTNYSSLYGTATLLRFDADGPTSVFTPVSFTPGFLLKNFFWNLFAYLCCALLGLLITTLYYRMDRPRKILVSVGVPSFFLIFLPLIDRYLAGDRIYPAITALGERWLVWGTDPVTDALTRLLLAAVLAGLAFLLVRRAEIKR